MARNRAEILLMQLREKEAKENKNKAPEDLTLLSKDKLIDRAKSLGFHLASDRWHIDTLIKKIQSKEK